MVISTKAMTMTRVPTRLIALPAQFQADAEEEQYQAQVGQKANHVQVADQGCGEGKGSDDDSGHQVSEDRRLLDEPEED